VNARQGLRFPRERARSGPSAPPLSHQRDGALKVRTGQLDRAERSVMVARFRRRLGLAAPGRIDSPPTVEQRDVEHSDMEHNDMEHSDE